MQSWQESVKLPYSFYNSILEKLYSQKNIDISLLNSFSSYCENKTAPKNSTILVENFFLQHAFGKDNVKRIAFITDFLSLIERQVVLLKAIEESAFIQSHDMHDAGSLQHLLNRIKDNDYLQSATNVQRHSLRIVLKTNFSYSYPPKVLYIIAELCDAISIHELKKIYDLLIQLENTSLDFPEEEESISNTEMNLLMYYLKGGLFPSIQNVQNSLMTYFQKDSIGNPHLIEQIALGIWPVNEYYRRHHSIASQLLETAKNCKNSILQIYRDEVSALKKKLTFIGIEEKLESIENCLDWTWRHTNTSAGDFPYAKQRTTQKNTYQSSIELLKDLLLIRDLLITEHDSVFLHLLDKFIITVRVFGFHFASIEMSQDSRILSTVVGQILKILSRKQKLPKGLDDTSEWYGELSSQEKLQLLNKILQQPVAAVMPWESELDEVAKDTIASFSTISSIQHSNGERGLNRYIVTHTQALHSVLEVLLLANWSAIGKEQLHLDIVPLLETIEDLENATALLGDLFHHQVYRAHLKRRGDVQIVMMDFADSIKDGGLFASHWTIYNTKIKLTTLAAEEGVQIVFFDGQGGPIAYGAAFAHRYYKIMGENFEQQAIQVGVEEETAATQFSNPVKAQDSIEELLTAALDRYLFSTANSQLSEEDSQIIKEISQISYNKYSELIRHPSFGVYMESVTPLKFLCDDEQQRRRVGISSNSAAEIDTNIFLQAWHQVRQNVSAFYGLGSALEMLMKRGNTLELKGLYKRAPLFRIIIDQVSESLCKSDFRLTLCNSDKPPLNAIGEMIAIEAVLTRDTIKKITGEAELLAAVPFLQEDIAFKKQMALPVLALQQHCLANIKTLDGNTEQKVLFEKYQQLLLRTISILAKF